MMNTDFSRKNVCLISILDFIRMYADVRMRFCLYFIIQFNGFDGAVDIGIIHAWHGI